MSEISNNAGELHVLLQSSNTYVVPTAIALYSLCENNISIQNLVIHLISDGIQPENISLLENKVEQFGRKIQWIDGFSISKMLEKAGVAKHCGSYTTYMKLFALNLIQEQCPECEKVFYLDSDIIVAGNLEELITLNMGNYIIGGVDEFTTLKYRKKLGIKRNSFNGGVVLYNIKEWQKNDCEQVILENLKSSDFVQSLTLADQDIMNMLFETKIMSLPPKYNYTTWFEYYDRDTYVKRLHLTEDFCSKEEIKQAGKSPAVIHYLDIWTGRPWDIPNANPFTGIYQEYYRKAGITVKFETIQRKGIRKILKNTIVFLLNNLSRHAGGFMIYGMSKVVQVTGLK